MNLDESHNKIRATEIGPIGFEYDPETGLLPSNALFDVGSAVYPPTAKHIDHSYNLMRTLFANFGNLVRSASRAKMYIDPSHVCVCVCVCV